MRTMLKMGQIAYSYMILCGFFWMVGCQSNSREPQPVKQFVYFLDPADSKQVDMFLSYVNTSVPARITSSGDQYNNWAIAEYLKGNYAKALTYMNQAVAFRVGDEFATAKSYNNLAAVYQAQGEYKKALELYRQAADMLQRLQKTEWYTYAQANYIKLVASAPVGGRVVADPPQHDPPILFVEY